MQPLVDLRILIKTLKIVARLITKPYVNKYRKISAAMKFILFTTALGSSEFLEKASIEQQRMLTLYACC